MTREEERRILCDRIYNLERRVEELELRARKQGPALLQVVAPEGILVPVHDSPRRDAARRRGQFSGNIRAANNHKTTP